jgi:hypothetical protein
MSDLGRILFHVFGRQVTTGCNVLTSLYPTHWLASRILRSTAARLKVEDAEHPAKFLSTMHSCYLYSL